MKRLSINYFATSVAASMCLLCASALATDVTTAQVRVAGEKLDSGLGELPHYSKWGVRVVGEKLDSGLGDLPHYSKWADPTGKNPLQAAAPVQRDERSPQRPTVRVSQAN